MSSDKTTIQVKKETLSKLTSICRKDQTYDELLNVLVDKEKKKP